MGEWSWHAREPGQAQDGRDEQHDIAAGHGQQVREARGAERLHRAIAERGRAAERDARGDAACFVVAAGLEGGARAMAQAVEGALDAAAPAEYGERAGREGLVHALAREPGVPVEAVARRRDGGERPADLDDGSLLEEAASAQLDGMAVQVRDRRAAEGARPRLAVDDQARALDVPDARGQGIGGTRQDAVLGPGRAKQPAGRCDNHGEWREPAAAEHQQERCERQQRQADRPRRGERGRGESGGQPGSGDRSQLVGATAGRHSASRGRSDSSRTGPMPLTASSSSTEPNPPWASR